MSRRARESDRPAPSAPVDLGGRIPRETCSTRPPISTSATWPPSGSKPSGDALPLRRLVYPTLGSGCAAGPVSVDEMGRYKEYSVSTFHFTDPVLNIPTATWKPSAGKQLREAQVRWSGFMRKTT